LPIIWISQKYWRYAYLYRLWYWQHEEIPFFTFKEVQLATSMLKKIYRKARVPESLQEKFYRGSHKFDRPMQVDAIHWLDRWLK